MNQTKQTPPLISARLIQDEIVGAIERAFVMQTPFCLIRLADAFSDSLYRQLIESLPPDSAYSEFKHPDALDAYGNSTRYSFRLESDRLELLPAASRQVWEPFAAAITSDRVKEAYFRAVAPDLAVRFGISQADVPKIVAFPKAALLRDYGGYKILPHSDSQTKIVTAHFYLPRDCKQLESGTVIYERTSKLKWSPFLKPKCEFTKLRTLEFIPNSGFAFAVGPNSWHGVDQLPTEATPRDSISLLYFREPGHSYA